MPNVIWQPQRKQGAFMRRPEYECLYGGAAGGGKSDALLAEALRQVPVPHYRAIILRKTYPQLSELIDRSRAIYQPAFPQARYNQTEHFWQFPSGAKIYFGSMQHTKDRINYQGKRYDFIAFDELTHFTWDEYSYMFSRNRPSGPGTRVYIRATTNPGGIGHGWVKSRFILPSPPLTPIWEDYQVVGADGKAIQLRRNRVFVPATVFDNQRLLDNDPMYLANLAMMPEAERNALLYGSWDSFDGQVFTEWRNDPAHYQDQRFTHVIDPFQVPAHWRIFRGFDFGYAKPFSVGWFAVDENGKIYHIKEYYGCNGTPNKGVMMEPTQIASEIRRIEQEDPMLKGRKIVGIADPSIFDESRGESVARMMERSPNFVYWMGADNTRIPGKMQYHYRLAFDKDGDCMFQVFHTCKHFVRTIPDLVYDEKHVEDINTEQEDHIYDMCRYVFMEHPIAPRKNVLVKPLPDDPLDLCERSGNALFFRV
ncbi:terminase family protein [Cuneatibacter sp. NSJ-177]|uniref:terminase large subunit domain-containing protein n=1 Tax=Cuneatibacter sp. NSJ-177 TaxID=2931401 RepID=UPI001FD5A345|nr:terminase family protein [Cuneatibacter sp. NSJ-177]MCJ7837459.1 terminase family protein [Cuneatibacter sp. NSJ-177]